MHDQLQNYTQLQMNRKIAVRFPHKSIISLLILFLIGLIVASTIQYIELSQKDVTLATLKQQETLATQNIQALRGSTILGSLKRSQINEKKGFYIYFAYLSSFPYYNIWFNRIQIANNPPNIILKGDSKTGESMQHLFHKLNIKESPFYTKNLHIAEFTTIKSQEATQKSRRLRRRRQRGKQKIDDDSTSLAMHNTYRFTITTNKPPPKVDKRRRRRR